jgi:hypothetical protein
VIARRQDFHLGHAIEQVVVRLADDGLRHAELLAPAHHLGDAPAAIVGEAEVADLAGTQELADRADGLGQRRARIVLVQVIDVDPVGAKAREARVARGDDPAA